MNAGSTRFLTAEFPLKKECLYPSLPIHTGRKHTPRLANEKQEMAGAKAPLVRITRQAGLDILFRCV